MCPPGYHHSGFVATHALGHMMSVYIYIYKFVAMAHHFILLRFNPFDLRVDKMGWWFEHSVSWLRVCLSAEGAKEGAKKKDQNSIK